MPSLFRFPFSIMTTNQQSPAERRCQADLTDRFQRYGTLSLHEKIRLAMTILWDVANSWDDENLISYPKTMPSFHEYLADIGSDLYAIEWKNAPTPTSEG